MKIPSGWCELTLMLTWEKPESRSLVGALSRLGENPVQQKLKTGVFGFTGHEALMQAAMSVPQVSLLKRQVQATSMSDGFNGLLYNHTRRVIATFSEDRRFDWK